MGSRKNRRRWGESLQRFHLWACPRETGHCMAPPPRPVTSPSTHVVFMLRSMARQERGPVVRMLAWGVGSAPCYSQTACETVSHSLGFPFHLCIVWMIDLPCCAGG